MTIIDMPAEDRQLLLIQALVALIVTSAVVVAVIKQLKPKKIGPKGVEFGDSIPNTCTDTNPIADHRLFRYLRQYVLPGAFSFDQNTDKAVIMENYLRLKFRTVHDVMLDYFCRAEKRKFEDLQDITEELASAVALYERKSENLTHDLPQGRLVGIPKSLRRKFATWHQRHADQAFSDLEDLLYDATVLPGRSLADRLADAILYAMRETIFDARMTLPELNGDLDEDVQVMLKKQGLLYD